VPLLYFGSFIEASFGSSDPKILKSLEEIYVSIGQTG